MDNISSKIDTQLIGLHKRHKTLPYGSYAKIARKFGVSREWVGVRAKQLNIQVIGYVKEKIKCNYCQKPFRPPSRKSMFCSRECSSKYKHYSRNHLLICSNCNKGFLRITGNIETNKRRHTHRNDYCSRKCFFVGSRSNNSRKWMSKVKKEVKKN